ncbi:MAG: FG-GAP repeat domain-containing protein, partial [Pirellulales bacterium]
MMTNDSQSSPGNPVSDDVQNDDVIGKQFRRSSIVIGCLLLAGLGFAAWRHWPRQQTTTNPSELQTAEVRAAPQVDVPKMLFSDITAQAGIRFRHENGAAGEKLLPETMGGGCAFLDYDNDGDQDLLLVNSRHWDEHRESDAGVVLYRNDGSGHFVDVSNAVGFKQPLYGMGCAVGDFDNDGFVDVFVTAVGSNHLFHNRDGKGFDEITEMAGVGGDAQAWSTSGGWFDYDDDGDLDLLVVNYVQWSRENDLAQHFTLEGTRRAYGRPKEFRGTHPYLYRNEGRGRFTDVTQPAGLQIRNPVRDEPLSKSLGLTFADFNRDGAIDILIANDTVRNLMFINQKDGTFEEVGIVAGVAFDIQGNARGAMGADSADIRNSTALGIVIGNFANEMTALYVSNSTVDGLAQFTDEAVSNGLGPVTRLELTFGVFFFDADLDGRLDLFAANGHLEKDIQIIQPSQHYEQAPQLLWNCGPEH